MLPLYNANGLMFWSEEEVRFRDFARDYFARGVQDILIKENPAWRFVYFEGPLLTPRELINANYTNADVWVQESDLHIWEQRIMGGMTTNTDAFSPDEIAAWKADAEAAHREGMPTGSVELVLRPETTPGSYQYACHLLNSHSGFKPPLCVWQAGKSFRRESDQPTKHMRLKEFYQQEFQCIYTADTLNDYHDAVLEPVRKMIASIVPMPTRIVKSDRLPSYSQTTMDIEVDVGWKWMEVCSISRRIDFPIKAKFQGKNGIIEKDLLVVEIAIGLDRILSCYSDWAETR